MSSRLFAALTAKEDVDAGARPSAVAPREAIQLHADRAIDFLNATTVYLRTPAGASKPGAGAESGDDGKNAADAAGEGRGSTFRDFAALSYQAIQTHEEDGRPSAAAGGEAARRRHLRPDLGVWDCRVSDGNETALAMLLQRVVVDKASLVRPDSNGEETRSEGTADEAAGGGISLPPPIVLAVDLADPTEVQPTIERMRRVILSVFADFGEKKMVSNNLCQARQCTTSIKVLQSASFGKALIQEPVTVNGGGGVNEPRIALILAAIVPNTQSSSDSSVAAAEEYRERQARALLLYHLHKFSLELDCTLCFVSDKKSAATDAQAAGEGVAVPATAAAEPDRATLSVDALGRLVRRVARGLSPEEGSGNATKDAAGEAQEPDAASPASPALPPPPAVHAPGLHDAALISGAYRRNASCEGRWDAGTDDLAVALPPRLAAGGDGGGGSGGGGAGDEEWLSRLATSMGHAPAPVPTAAQEQQGKKDRAGGAAAKKRPVRSRAAARNKDAKPKDEKEVMNFFDTLLKK